MINQILVETLKERSHKVWFSKPRMVYLDYEIICNDMMNSLANVLIAPEDILRAFWDIYLDSPLKSGPEYKDRKGEREVDGCKYVAIKLLIPEVRWITLCGTDCLSNEYLMLHVHDNGKKLDLEFPAIALHRKGVEA